MQSNYTKSKRTDQDIKHITKQSITDFGEMQTDKYLDGLEESLLMLADKPNIGRRLTRGNITKKKYQYHRYVRFGGFPGLTRSMYHSCQRVFP